MPTTPIIPETNLELRIPNAAPLTPDQHDSNFSKIEASLDPIKVWFDSVPVSTIVARVATGELDGFDPETIIRDLLKIVNFGVGGTGAGGAGGLIEDAATRDQTGPEIEVLLDSAGFKIREQTYVSEDGIETATALLVGATQVASGTIALPAGMEWKWVKVVFATNLDDTGGSPGGGYEHVDVRIGGVGQSWAGNPVALQMNNSDDAAQIFTQFEGVPSTINASITVEVRGQQSGGGLDIVADRHAYLVGLAETV